MKVLKVTKFSQKYAIIALMEPIKEGTEFPAANFPLHITLIGVFAIGYDGQTMAEMMSDLVRQQKPVTVRVEELAMLGPKRDVEVMAIEKSTELVDLHYRLYDLLVKAGAVFNDPQYQAEGFKPHSTIINGQHLNTGDTVTIDSLSIIDLFPAANGERRKILKTLKLNG